MHMGGLAMEVDPVVVILLASTLAGGFGYLGGWLHATAKLQRTLGGFMEEVRKILPKDMGGSGAKLPTNPWQLLGLVLQNPALIEKVLGGFLSGRRPT